ncbi:dienelactone hydrolase family protein [Actinophytocola sediminis]
MLHEERGVTDSVPALVDALAAEGWLVVAPQLDAETMLAGTDLAFGWLAQQGIGADMIGIVGFELGGSVAMVVAASRDIGAAVSVAGGGIRQPSAPGLPALIDVAGELRCPWLGLYADKFTDEVELLREAAARSVTATDVVVFPSTDHRFDLHPDAAFESWQRMLNWFDAHLR